MTGGEKARDVAQWLGGAVVIAALIGAGWFGLGRDLSAGEALTDAFEPGETVTLAIAPASQCADVREATGAADCIPDRKFMARLAEDCAKQRKTGLHYLDKVGTLTSQPDCDASAAEASKQLLEGIDLLPPGITMDELATQMAPE